MMLAEKEGLAPVKPGQDLVVTGYIGLEGTKRIVKQRKEELLSRFSAGYLEQIRNIPDGAFPENPDDLKNMRAIQWERVGEGGIHTALWNISGAFGVGFRIQLHRIPIKQETIEICEFYDLDPYDLYTSHCLVLITDNGGHAVSALKQEGVPAAWIGTITKGAAREVFYGKVRRFMDRPKPDELYKIYDTREVL